MKAFLVKTSFSGEKVVEATSPRVAINKVLDSIEYARSKVVGGKSPIQFDFSVSVERVG